MFLVFELPTDRLDLHLPKIHARAYGEAKATLAVAVTPPGKRRLQLIAPSADRSVT